ncbi:ABC transporter substrate-binding protein [Aneurinibacillus sp. Ricciae_BoGa-3]|uniref:ABC transporter substrate-binding protein n=1 Tax=Aneurinibacillus sp. Ricciae_BoGa-3 TaxID=3022697 RepID=UPI0023413A43|nr:ABC transporter substrate-binding protein [Aneurinibacillus sp. Ricciae_BoGa-3]WCK52661.1 ABC transporter substrate-binding protein [Aneurinibacillus sp. Ricciae_BoGa-3]
MRVKSALAALCLLLVALMTGCAKNANETAAQGGNQQAASSQNNSNPAGKDTLVVAITSDQGTLDPAITMDNSAWKITYPAYERLVEYDGASTEVKASLAKQWKVSKDGLTWTFVLNKDHKFADGTPVDANAVKYSFDRTLKIAKGPVDVYGVIKDVKVIDPTTVQFTLKKSFPPFLSTLAANYGSIVNPKVELQAKNNDMGQNYLADHTMGSGPYQLAEWKKGEYLKLAVNPNSPEKPALKTVFFKIIPDSSAQRLQLEKGEIDFAEGIPVEQLQSIDKMPNATLVKKPSLFVDYIYINTSKGKKELMNPKVRQALSYAIDYPALTKAVQQGYATQMRGPIPEGLWGHDSSAKQYTKDNAKAKALLQQAGVKDLTLDFVYSDNKPWWETEATTVQAYMAEIGVKVNLKKVAYATQREMIDKGDFDLSIGVWSPDFGDPFMFMNYWFDSNNFGLAGNRAFYKNPKVDQLVREAATTNDKTVREKLYKEAQAIVIDDAPYLFLYQKDFLLPMNKEVKGFVYNPMLEGIYNLSQMSK